MTLRAVCAKTRSLSISLMFSIPSLIPALVISVNCTLCNFSSGISVARCDAIASPSLSGSVAISTLLATFDFFLSSVINFFLSGKTVSLISKLFSISMPKSFFGRSLTCPTQEITSYSLPRCFCIVFTFVGDSTINSDFVFILFSVIKLLQKFVFYVRTHNIMS